MMKELVIIYNQPLNSKQGINTVNNSFIEGQKYFNENEIYLSSIFGSDGIVDCKNRNSLQNSDIQQSLTQSTNKFAVSNIKQLLPKKNALIEAARIYRSCYVTARKTINYFLQSGCDPDYIIFQDPQTAQIYYSEFGKGRRSKTIMILHCSISATEQAETTWPSFFRSKVLSKRFYETYIFSMQNVDKLIYLSQRAVDNSPVAPEKKTCIFNGEEDLDVHEITEPHNPINMTCVGSMSWHKGQDYVIEAISKLPEDIRNLYKLHLIGSGPQIQELKDLVAKYNLQENVIFYGNRNDVPELLRQMDLYIMPSISEGLPMSIIEALRQGMYVIGTDTGAIPEMISPGCGELVERDAEKIAECLTKVVKENRITLNMKKNAREHYLKHFTLKSMIYNYCDVLKSL